MRYQLNKIEDFFQAYKQAAFDQNVDGMISLYDDEVVVFDMWGKGSISGIMEWSTIIKAWLTSLGDEKVTVSFEMINIHEDSKIGFASAIIQFAAIAPDESVLRSMKNRITIGFIKTDGFWKVKHQHTSAPIDSSLKAILNI